VNEAVAGVSKILPSAAHYERFVKVSFGVFFVPRLNVLADPKFWMLPLTQILDKLLIGQNHEP
jgi:hypothetical protein